MSKNLKYYTPENHAVLNESSTFEQTFQYVGKEEILRGIYYWDSERSVVYLSSHEDIEDIINTCAHETVHHCIFQIAVGDDEGRGTLTLDIEQEHDIIRNMAWANYWGVNNCTQIRGALIKSKIQLAEESKLYNKYTRHFLKEIDNWI